MRDCESVALAAGEGVNKLVPGCGQSPVIGTPVEPRWKSGARAGRSTKESDAAGRDFRLMGQTEWPEVMNSRVSWLKGAYPRWLSA
ncbi:hypothetical protein NN561_012247 [Cricetulus griseus]